MIRPMSAIKICIVTFAAFLLCSCVTHRTIIRQGNSELKITVENGKLTEEVCKGDIGMVKKCFDGNIVDLKLVDTKNNVTAKIVEISDFTTISVDPGTAGGNCTFYFWSGRYWQVCQ